MPIGIAGDRRQAERGHASKRAAAPFPSSLAERRRSRPASPRPARSRRSGPPRPSPAAHRLPPHLPLARTTPGPEVGPPCRAPRRARQAFGSRRAAGSRMSRGAGIPGLRPEKRRPAAAQPVSAGSEAAFLPCAAAELAAAPSACRHVDNEGCVGRVLAPAACRPAPGTPLTRSADKNLCTGGQTSTKHRRTACGQ